MDVIDLSRLVQFALTALYHFLFVPLDRQLIFLLAIMENPVRGDRQNSLPRHDAFLGKAIRY